MCHGTRNLRVASRTSMKGCHASAVIWVFSVFVEVKSQIGWVAFCSSGKAKLNNSDKNIMSRKKPL